MLRNIDFEAIDLSGCNLRGARFIDCRLRYSNWQGADATGVSAKNADAQAIDFTGAQLEQASFSGATLSGSKLVKANAPGIQLRRTIMHKVNAYGADLCGANLTEALLHRASLREARLRGADFTRASLVNVRLQGTDLSGSCVYGVAAWDLETDDATCMADLIVTSSEDSCVTVDDLKVAQFIYLLLKNVEVRHIIDSITSKVVLILGRFSAERKPILDALRKELRKRDYTPILFDFEKPKSRDLTETILTLAGMARFVIADITGARSIPQELSHIVPHLPSVPVQPLFLASEGEYAMFEHWRRYPWVLPAFLYEDSEHLICSLLDGVIQPPEQYWQTVLRR